MHASLTLIALVGLAAPAGAQQAPPQDSSRTIWDAIRLPQTVVKARSSGMTGIWPVLDSLHRHGVPAADAGQIIQEEADAVKAGAPPENFGKFVNEQLARGLRGRDLAAAIHAEHARRGVGQGQGKAGAAGEHGGQGAPDAAKGKGKEKGKGRKP